MTCKIEKKKKILSSVNVVPDRDEGRILRLKGVKKIFSLEGQTGAKIFGERGHGPLIL